MPGPMPATGILGVGSGVGDGFIPGVAVVSHVSVGVAVGSHVSVGVAVGPSVGVVLGPGVGVLVGVGVGPGVSVGVIVGVGVLVGVGPGVLVGVGIGVFGVMEKTSLQLELTAYGVACGTVGATDWSVSSFVEVMYATTPIPIVRKVTSNKYQYFFKKFISFPCIVYKHFRIYDKIRNAGWYCVCSDEFSCIV